MLLPSAFSCDSSHSHYPRAQTPLFASPPASPPSVYSQSAIGNIFDSCRSLQSILTGPPSSPTPTTASQLPTPPLAHAQPPLKLRLRTRKLEPASDHIHPRKVVKRTHNNTTSSARGLKRRRGAGEHAGQDNEDVASDLDISEDAPSAAGGRAAEEDLPPRPQTPKRARIAPEAVPLGLARSDYHNLHADGLEGDDDVAAASRPGTNIEVEADGEEWSAEDDRILVELILEKLKLTKSDWQDCARTLGKDRLSLGRRWKSLMVNGEVGLKTRGRRGKIHSTWR